MKAPSQSGVSLPVLPGGHKTPSFFTDFRGYKKYASLCVMLLPVIVYFIIFKYIPMSGLALAFKDFQIAKGIWASPWVGLKYFEKALKSRTFIRSFQNTLIISLLKIFIGFPMPILFALMLNELRSLRFKKAIQTVSYLPHFLSWVVVAGLMTQLLSPNNGAVNYVLTKYMGFEKPIFFLGDNSYFRGTLIVSDIWKEVGWGSVLYIATIAGISPELYEAAVVDGATRFQRLLHVTLPSILPTITVMLILRVGSVMDAGFDQVFNLYNSAVYKTGDIIDTFVYRYGLGDMQYSFSTAVGLFKNVIGFVLVVGTNAITNKLNGTGIW